MLTLRLLCFISLPMMAYGQHSPFDFKRTNWNKKSTVSASINNNRNLATENEKLSQVWWNWNFCSNAFPNASFTPMNSLVPNSTIFLAGYPTFKLDNNTATCKSKTVTRTATIGVGKQTLFYPLYNEIVFDWDDDYEEKICANFTNETTPQRLAYAAAKDEEYKNANFTALLYSTIDGVAVAPTYIYNTEVFYFVGCPGNLNKTYEEYFKLLDPESKGDTCDKEPFESFAGLDAYPTLGWYGIDTREWKDGENHTYEFGSLTNCVTAKYVITAKAEEGEGECGLFGLGLFCPLKWFQWLCDLFA